MREVEAGIADRASSPLAPSGSLFMGYNRTAKTRDDSPVQIFSPARSAGISEICGGTKMGIGCPFRSGPFRPDHLPNTSKLYRFGDTKNGTFCLIGAPAQELS